MTEPILVVDIGTTTCSAMLVVEGKAELLTEPAGGSIVSWPSALLALDGEHLIGSRAEKRGRARPRYFQDEFKCLIGTDKKIMLGNTEYEPKYFVTVILRACRAAAERRRGGPVDRALLTVPAAYEHRSPARRQMLAAGRAAGFALVELLDEPVATANAPLDGRSPQAGELVLVYDWGGGTFDAALVRIDDDGQQTVLEVGGLRHCGGRDIDTRILDAMTKSSNAAAPDVRSRWARTRWARDLKHELSQEDPILDDYDDGEIVIPAQLSRDQLVELARPLVEQTIQTCRLVLERADVDPATVDSLILSGGASRLPSVAEALDDALGIDLRPVRSPELAVIEGAAQWALRAAGRSVASVRPAFGSEPLSWPIPSGAGTVVRWEVQPGERYAQGADLGITQITDGALWRLRAYRPGRVLRHHVQEGDDVVEGQWLVTTEIDRSTPGAALAEPVLLMRRTLKELNRTPSIISVGRAILRDLSDLFSGRPPDQAKAQDERWKSVDIGYTPNGRCVAVTTTGTEVEVWDVESASLLCAALCTAERVVLSPDGHLVATIPPNRGSGNYDLTMWLLADDELTKFYTVKVANNSSIFSFSPKSDYFCVPYREREVKVHASSDGHALDPVYLGRSYRYMRSLSLGAPSIIHAAIVDDFGQEYNLLLRQSGWFEEEDLVPPFAFSSDGTWIVGLASGGRSKGSESYVRRVDDPEGATSRRVLRPAPGELRSAAFDLSGGALAMGWSSGWVSVIDTEDWSSRAVFAHGPVPVGAVRFSPLGDQLVVTGGGAVSVWALTDAA